MSLVNCDCYVCFFFLCSLRLFSMQQAFLPSLSASPTKVCTDCWMVEFERFYASLSAIARIMQSSFTLQSIKIVNVIWLYYSSTYCTGIEYRCIQLCSQCWSDAIRACIHQDDGSPLYTFCSSLYRDIGPAESADQIMTCLDLILNAGPLLAFDTRTQHSMPRNLILATPGP